MTDELPGRAIVGRALGFGAASMAVWLLAAAKLDLAEPAFSAGAGALGAWIALHLDARGLAWLRRASPPARLGVEVPRSVLRDLGVVLGALGAVLGRRALLEPVLDGRLTHLPFEPGADDARSAARRALVVGLASLSPNTIAVAVEPGGSLVVHQLVARSSPRGGKTWPL